MYDRHNSFLLLYREVLGDILKHFLFLLVLFIKEPERVLFAVWVIFLLLFILLLLVLFIFLIFFLFIRLVRLVINIIFWWFNERLDLDFREVFQLKLIMSLQNLLDPHGKGIMGEELLTVPEDIWDVVLQHLFFDHVFTRAIFFGLESMKDHIEVQIPNSTIFLLVAIV